MICEKIIAEMLEIFIRCSAIANVVTCHRVEDILAFFDLLRTARFLHTPHMISGKQKSIFQCLVDPIQRFNQKFVMGGSTGS